MSGISTLDTAAEIAATHELMSQLHDKVRRLSRDAYVRYVSELQDRFGYQLAVKKRDLAPVCAAGFRICENLGWGRYLYVDDLITDAQFRSEGLGHEMMEWLIAKGVAEQCEELRLDARLDRKQAHQFYLREGMEIIAHHFRLSLRSQAAIL